MGLREMGTPRLSFDGSEPTEDERMLDAAAAGQTRRRRAVGTRALLSGGGTGGGVGGSATPSSRVAVSGERRESLKALAEAGVVDPSLIQYLADHDGDAGDASPLPPRRLAAPPPLPPVAESPVLGPSTEDMPPVPPPRARRQDTGSSVASTVSTPATGGGGGGGESVVIVMRERGPSDDDEEDMEDLAGGMSSPVLTLQAPSTVNFESIRPVTRPRDSGVAAPASLLAASTAEVASRLNSGPEDADEDDYELLTPLESPGVALSSSVTGGGGGASFAGQRVAVQRPHHSPAVMSLSDFASGGGPHGQAGGAGGGAASLLSPAGSVGSVGSVGSADTSRRIDRLPSKLKELFHM